MTRKPVSFIFGAIIIGAVVVLGSASVVSGGERSRTCEPPAVVFDPDSGMTAPKVEHKVDPKYPTDALKAGASGDVVLGAVIDSRGVVADVDVIDSPHQSLSAAAEKALRQWRFEPARDKDGILIDVCFKVTIQFHLK